MRLTLTCYLISYMTTKLNNQSTFFLLFNKGNNGGKGNSDAGDKIRVHYMWEDILSKDTLFYFNYSMEIIIFIK